MGRPFRVLIPQRSFHSLRYRLVLVLIVFVLFGQNHRFFKYQDALAAKYSPTDFTAFTEQQPKVLDEESVQFQDQLVANRAAWRPLREGWEGRTFVYSDSVIKTFTPGRSPFRNCAQGTGDGRWPTEIPASLYFGGSGHNASSSHSGFLPVKAFFMAASSTSQAEWHMVTPLLKGGSLQDLAAEVRKQNTNYQDIDAKYRPAFMGLLRSLQTLHEAGYCHDDVKPGNVLVADETHWVLGDLGNLRHITHPYHTSLLWRENEQLIDCRANDGIRALKSYVHFVRDVAVDKDGFDTDFFERREPLSRLFWSAAADATHLNVAELRAKSAAEESHLIHNDESDSGTAVPIPRSTWLSVVSRRWSRRDAVDQVLQTRMGEKTARWWALTWVFGVPVPALCKL
ncbi:hypothetical protein OPT61_g5703 [Boeremia exigua]|uniref:Uncharacterized protein n=1 Tax=Boeremia exigua TaxID=749465 RepID=A0ACC2I9C3_9PLEO|nr:hypothetical protein OPT61_g5703 [Boeremia exigua]